MVTALALILAFGDPGAAVRPLEAKAGDFSYRALAGAEEVRIFNAGREIERVVPDCSISDLAVHGTSLYVACEANMVRRYDIADTHAHQPVLVETIATEEALASLEFRDGQLNLEASAPEYEPGEVYAELKVAMFETAAGGLLVLLGLASATVFSLGRGDSTTGESVLAYGISGAVVVGGGVLVGHGAHRWHKFGAMARELNMSAGPGRTALGTRTFNFGIRF